MGMLDDMLHWATGRREPAIDPSSFNDPIALTTDWTPLSPGGANFKTHSLVLTQGGSLVMRKGLGIFLFGGAFMLAGLALMVSMASADQWSKVPFGLIFVGGGVFIVWPKSVLFDADLRQVVFSSGPVSFNTVHAVQIIKERVSGNKTTYTSYELNLVLKSGLRRNVTDHSDLQSIRGDSDRIAALIGCRVWDAT